MKPPTAAVEPPAAAVERPIAAVSPELQGSARKAARFTLGARGLRLGRRLTRLMVRAPKGLVTLVARLVLRAPAMPAGIRVTDTYIASPDQARIRIRLYRPCAAAGAAARAAAPPAPALLWLHGGGYVIGAPEQDDGYVVPFIRNVGVLVASVDYRLAPDHPFPAPLEDCYAALCWLTGQAAGLGIDPARIAIGGDSAGAGLAAALAQLALDRGGPRPVCQLLVYPMLDDRTAARADIDPKGHLVWNNTSNRFGWEAYLGQPPGAASVPAGSVPARRADLAGLRARCPRPRRAGLRQRQPQDRDGAPTAVPVGWAMQEAAL